MSLPQHPACPAFGHHVTAERVTHMLDRLETLHLVRPQAAVLPLPSVVRLLGRAKFPHHLGQGLPLSQTNLSLAKLPYDLFRVELLPSWHLLPSLGVHHPRFSL